MHTKFPASMMVIGVVSGEEDVMPPHFFFFKVPELMPLLTPRC